MLKFQSIAGLDYSYDVGGLSDMLLSYYKDKKFP